MDTVFASPDLLPEIITLWRDAFPSDTKQDIQDFLTAAYAPNRCLLALADGKPISMAFLLPAELKFADNRNLNIPFKLQYIYAAATLTPYRGKGIFGNLLNKAKDISRTEGIQASFLRAAESSLFSYYARFGYRTFFMVKEEKTSRSEFLKGYSCKANLNKNTHSEMLAERSKILKRFPVWVQWPDNLVNYAVASAKKIGGDIISVDGGWALCEPAGDFLWIREWLCEPFAQASLRFAVEERFHAKTIAWRRPAVPNIDVSSEPFGMLCPLANESEKLLNQYNKQFPYMGLAFD